MNITQFSIEEIKDPTGILEGKRYELLLDVEVDEVDELFTENGLELRVLLAVKEDHYRIVQHFFHDRVTSELLEFALEEDEEAEVLQYCIDVMTEDVSEI